MQEYTVRDVLRVLFILSETNAEGPANARINSWQPGLLSRTCSVYENLHGWRGLAPVG